MATEKDKKQKKVKEPQYYTSPTGIPVLNYRVYDMNIFEFVFTILLAFAVGAFVGYLFFGNIGLDEYDQATKLTKTLNLIIPSTLGTVCAIIFLPIRRKSLQQKRVSELSRQFRDLLEGLTTSLGAGSNVPQSFRAVHEDLAVQYDQDAFIIKELEVILSGIDNNFPIDEMIRDLGNRSDNDDIKSFADVFAVCFRKGGNIANVIHNTHEVLSQKMAISEEIQTTIASGKNSLNVMLFMPIVLISIIKGMGKELASNFASPIGIFASFVGLCLFIVAYIVGQKVMDIKV